MNSCDIERYTNENKFVEVGTEPQERCGCLSSSVFDKLRAISTRLHSCDPEAAATLGSCTRHVTPTFRGDRDLYFEITSFESSHTDLVLAGNTPIVLYSPRT